LGSLVTEKEITSPKSGGQKGVKTLFVQQVESGFQKFLPRCCALMGELGKIFRGGRRAGREGEKCRGNILNEGKGDKRNLLILRGGGVPKRRPRPAGQEQHEDQSRRKTG